MRADSLKLRLIDVLGVEIPIAVAMAGLVLVHIAARMTQGTILLVEQFDLLASDHRLARIRKLCLSWP